MNHYVFLAILMTRPFFIFNVYTRTTPGEMPEVITPPKGEAAGSIKPPDVAIGTPAEVKRIWGLGAGAGSAAAKAKMAAIMN